MDHLLWTCNLQSLNPTYFIHQCWILVIRNTVKTINIVKKYYYLNIEYIIKCIYIQFLFWIYILYNEYIKNVKCYKFYNIIYYKIIIPVMQTWISSIIIPVWFFRNNSNMLILCSRNISYIYQCRKWHIFYFNIFCGNFYTCSWFFD